MSAEMDKTWARITWVSFILLVIIGFYYLAPKPLQDFVQDKLEWAWNKTPWGN